jgi:acetate kinase
MAKKLNQACVLAINGGSSSINFALFEVGDSLRRILGDGIKMTERQIATNAHENLHNKQIPAVGLKLNHPTQCGSKFL